MKQTTIERYVYHPFGEYVKAGLPCYKVTDTWDASVVTEGLTVSDAWGLGELEITDASSTGIGSLLAKIATLQTTQERCIPTAMTFPEGTVSVESSLVPEEVYGVPVVAAATATEGSVVLPEVTMDDWDNMRDYQTPGATKSVAVGVGPEIVQDWSSATLGALFPGELPDPTVRVYRKTETLDPETSEVTEGTECVAGETGNMYWRWLGSREVHPFLEISPESGTARVTTESASVISGTTLGVSAVFPCLNLLGAAGIAGVKVCAPAGTPGWAIKASMDYHVPLANLMEAYSEWPGIQYSFEGSGKRGGLTISTGTNPGIQTDIPHELPYCLETIGTPQVTTDWPYLAGFNDPSISTVVNAVYTFTHDLYVNAEVYSGKVKYSSTWAGSKVDVDNDQVYIRTRVWNGGLSSEDLSKPGSEKVGATPCLTDKAGANLLLFRRAYTSSTYAYKGKLSLVAVTNRETSEGIACLVPFYREGVYGMYDLVAKKFWGPNVGTGTFGYSLD